MAIMLYTSWFVAAGHSIGIDREAAHYLAYDYSSDLRELWGEDAAVAVGVTSPGPEGGGFEGVYERPEQLAPAIGAVKAAGIERIGIYDLRGLLESGDVEPWLQALAETPPEVPSRGRWTAKLVRGLARGVGALLEVAR